MPENPLPRDAEEQQAGWRDPALVANVELATNIANLYGLAPGSTGAVQSGVLLGPPWEGAPEWEYQTREYVLSLSRGEILIESPAVKRVLQDAGIRLVELRDFAFVAPDVPTEIGPAVSSADRDAEPTDIELATNIAKLYQLTPGSRHVLPTGILPRYYRIDAPTWENQTREQLLNLSLGERVVKNPVLKKVLEHADIRLVDEGSFAFVHPDMPTEVSTAERAANAAHAAHVAALVPYGYRPSLQVRADAPAWEVETRERLRQSTFEDKPLSAEEVQVLRAKNIRLVSGGRGGYIIDWNADPEDSVPDKNARDQRAVNVARLYGLVEGSTRRVPLGYRPSQTTKEDPNTPEWEREARRLVNLVTKPGRTVPPEVKRVLDQALIALKERQRRGTYHVHPDVPLESNIKARVENHDFGTNVARLYGLEPGSTPLVPHGQRPQKWREGAPDWENQTRAELHELLQPGRLMPAEVKQVLDQAGVPLTLRNDGGYRISLTAPVEGQGNHSARNPSGLTAAALLPHAASHRTDPSVGQPSAYRPELNPADRPKKLGRR
ncbi:hypothetical protein ACQEU8_03960 [Streptomyces sp. CA-250714]|uniref:hypothetical protein n=1 Tax=Streptomyces sp. CA-250714 TaxID=3240060 RepID=UPI003D930B36